ncbi:TPA: glycoside hydrolase [bacterium]|nr:glycoside hydrolase [bacterium]
MKTLYVSFLWHLHQPLYKDKLTNTYRLPWVRLHSTKGYWDMVNIIEDYPDAKVTFNLTPSLLYQILDISKNVIKDLHYEISKKPIDSLTLDDKIFILQNFFLCNWETMVYPYPRFNELLKKRGESISGRELEKKAFDFTKKDFLDLIVLYNLIWFGFSERKDPFIKKLFEKGEGFTENERDKLLKKQKEIISLIIPKYKELQDKGQIEVSTSPFYHPILPILLDGKQSGFDFLSDAKEQIRNGISFYEENFGKKPKGMWPAEGGVSKEIFPLLKNEGIEWSATDEEILLNSIDSFSRSDIYKMYEINGIKLFFRDKNLSNLISFIYSKNKPEDAVSDLVARIEKIRDCTIGLPGEHIVSIILDGENPWEYYRDNGHGFLSGIYERIPKIPNVKMVTFSEFIKITKEGNKLSHIIPGSWIDHSFKIWIGKEEKDKAWNYLKRARDTLIKTAPDNTSAWEEIYIAEGSDWFWWYGDDFSSDQDDVFDSLFRTHLANVYKILNKIPPSYLDEPIAKPKFIKPQIEPVHLISPIIDGKITSYYEWLFGGFYDVWEPGGTMHISQTIISSIRYGYDFYNLYLAISTKTKVEEEVFVVDIISPNAYRIKFFPENYGDVFRVLNVDSIIKIGRLNSVCFGRILEVGIPFRVIEAHLGDEIRFVVSTERNGIIVESWPKMGFISITIPTKEKEAINWSA